MKLLGRKIIEDFKADHADARSSIDSWAAEVDKAKWEKPLDVLDKFPKASPLPNNRIVFKITGNAYRLVVQCSFKSQIVLVQKIGTHKEYDGWKLT